MNDKKELEGVTFNHDGKVYLVRCPECKAENYALSVPSGICTWCGYKSNEEVKSE